MPSCVQKPIQEAVHQFFESDPVEGTLYLRLEEQLQKRLSHSRMILKYKHGATLIFKACSSKDTDKH